MLTSERAPFTIQWTHEDGTPGRVDPNEPLEFIFDPVDAGAVSEVVTTADGRTATSTTTTGFVNAGSPATAAACDCTGDADFGAGKEAVVLRATFTVESPEARVTSGTFVLGAAEPKP